MKNIVRKMKIGKFLNNDNLSDDEKSIIDFIYDKLVNTEKILSNDFPNSIFYIDTICKFTIFEIRLDEDAIIIKYNGLWKVLHKQYKIDNNDIRILLKYIIEDMFKIKCTNINSTIDS
jgi:hypothetical protein